LSEQIGRFAVAARAAAQVLVDREISVVYSCMLCAGDYGREPLSRYFGFRQTLLQGFNFARLIISMRSFSGAQLVVGDCVLVRRLKRSVRKST
jgi:hypothetical protein